MVSTPRDFSSLSRAMASATRFSSSPQAVRIVLGDLGGHDEHVLVHERDAEIGGVDRSPRGIQLRHVADSRTPVASDGPDRGDGIESGIRRPGPLSSDVAHSKMTSGHPPRRTDADGDMGARRPRSYAPP